MQPKSTLEMRVGELLVKLGFLDEDQLEQALAVQREQTNYRPLGEICKDLGFISGQELRDILFRYQKQILLGELLQKLGIISNDQLNEAIQEQKRSGEKLGQILVKKKILTTSALVDSLSTQLGIAKIHPKKDMIDRDLINKANESYFRKKRVVPVHLDTDKRILTVVMEDPTDSETIGDLQKMFRASIEPAICPSGEVELVLEQIFDVWFDARRL
jgi:type IV pilus assembly protein PilB